MHASLCFYTLAALYGVCFFALLAEIVARAPEIFGKSVGEYAGSEQLFIAALAFCAATLWPVVVFVRLVSNLKHLMVSTK